MSGVATRVGCLILLLSNWGCGGSHETPHTVPTTKAVQPERAASKPALEASFRFADEKQARSELVARLGDQLLGEGWLELAPSWRPTLPATARSETRQGNSVLVTLRASAADVSRWLAEFEAAALQAPAPAQWQTQWLAALHSERARLLCRRRKQLLGVECDASGPEQDPEIAAIVTALASRLVLEPNLPDGVPVDVDGAVLWPTRIKVWQRTDDGLEALSGVPLTVEIQGEQSGQAKTTAPAAAVSSTDGSVQLTLPNAFDSARVTAFGAGTLGPLGSYWPGVAAKIHTRRLDRARCALLSERGPAQTPFEKSVRGQLHNAPGHEAIGVPPELGALVVQSQERALPQELLTRIVEATQGQLDYVAKVAVESEFASQMGNGRTWYEARAHVKVFEVWTGKMVDLFELSATESGIGDQGADAAARERLGALVGARLRQR